jgi:hypothetical protein
MNKSAKITVKIVGQTIHPVVHQSSDIEHLSRQMTNWRQCSMSMALASGTERSTWPALEMALLLFQAVQMAHIQLMSGAHCSCRPFAMMSV